MTTETRLTGPAAVLPAWGAAGATWRSLTGGLINESLVVEHPRSGRFLLQRLNPIFAPEVNEDIDAVTRHLAAQGVLTPLLLRADDGRAWVEHEGAVWRALSWIDGIALQRLPGAAAAEEAGAVLARFHVAVSGLKHSFRARRLGVHDTPRHLARLREALDAHRHHARSGTSAPLAAALLAAADRLESLPATPERIVHGDPKANNILFSADGSRALCLVDLDTVAPMAIPLELGDAFRSWCNPAGEEAAPAAFAVDLFAAGLKGYAGAAPDFLAAAEVAAIVPAILAISVELAARFCADALNENYFGWDPARFPTRSHHNQARAASQLRSAASLDAQRASAEAAVAAAFR